MKHDPGKSTSHRHYHLRAYELRVREAVWMAGGPEEALYGAGGGGASKPCSGDMAFHGW